MLKAIIGGKIVLGISDMNIARLKLGQPIKLNLEDLGLENREVFIFHGKDEGEMKKTLSSLIGPDTKMTDTSTI